MIEFRLKTFSSADMLIKNVEKKFAMDRISDEQYEISPYISEEFISMESDLDNFKIYFPEEFEYDRYDVEDCLRNIAPSVYTDVEQDGRIFVMTLTGKLNEFQYYKLAKYIIGQFGYIVFIKR